MELKNKIIKFIQMNRVSTTEVADCLGKKGALESISAVNQAHFKVGPIKYVYGFSESNWSIHEQSRDTNEGEIVFIDGIEVKGRALVGELVCKFLLFYRGAGAIVMLGKARDANDLIKHKFPVWCEGFNPVGCFNTKQVETPEVMETVNRRKKEYDGAIAVCDDTGVVVIPKSEITEEFYDKLVKIEEQEDIWFDCIDRKKWNTYDTVCLKKYLEEK